jgi:hypothetical protein
MAKTFKYGGYTFESRGQFKDFGIKPGKREMVEITSALHIVDWNNRFNVADGNEHFDYDEFYKASGGSDADVFYCPETGELYVPSAKVLHVFDKTSTDEDVEMRYRKRIAVREERERFAKFEALKNAMCFTEEQHQAFIKLRDVISECTDKGLEFAFDGDVVRVFRADLLKDITSNMVSMEGQIPVPQEMLYTCILTLHNAPDGLYANVK